MLMTSLSVAPSGVNVLFAHDTEVALQAAAALVNTASPDDVETMDTVADLDAFVAEMGLDRLAATHPSGAARRCRSCARGCAQSGPRTRTSVVEIVNTLLRDANALPQLVRHDEWSITCTPRRPKRRLPTGWPSRPRWPSSTSCARGNSTGCGSARPTTARTSLVDLSKNRSRRFCDSGCGNRANVAAYRARQRGIR